MGLRGIGRKDGQGIRSPGSWTMVSQACYTSSDARRYSRPYPLYFSSASDRRFPLSSHNARAVTMADNQLDSDSTPQRKRIAVAVRHPTPFSILHPVQTAGISASDAPCLLTSGPPDSSCWLFSFSLFFFFPPSAAEYRIYSKAPADKSFPVWPLSQKKDPVQRRPRSRPAMFQLQECRRGAMPVSTGTATPFSPKARKSSPLTPATTGLIARSAVAPRRR